MKTENKKSIELNIICCDGFKENIHNFGWFKLTSLDEIYYVMPHIKNTDYSLNYCPSCAKNVRDIVLSHDFYQYG